MSDRDWVLTFRAVLAREIRGGGELKDLPCPFCGLPRCRRTDYIRCSKCGVNWLMGEDLDHDPRVERMRILIANTPVKSRGEWGVI